MTRDPRAPARRPARPGAGITRAWLAVAAFAALAASTGAAPAQADPSPRHPLVARGRALLYEAQYDAALAHLARALADPGLARADRVEALADVVAIHLAFDRPVEARRALRQLWSLAPDHRPSALASPKVHAFFEAERPRFPRVQHDPARDVTLGSPVVVRARVAPLAPGQRVVLLHRQGAASAYRRQPMEPVQAARSDDGNGSGTGVFEARLATLLPGEPVLSYQLVVEESDGEPAATLGSAQAPLTVVLREVTRLQVVGGRGGPAASPPIYRRWWFYVLLGAAVAGGGAAAAVVATRGGNTSPNGTVAVHFGLGGGR
jgi:hypothetical protein